VGTQGGNSGKPEILFLCHRIPYPPDKGDKIRSYRWLRALAASEADRPAVPMTCWHSCGDNIVFPLGTAVWPGAEVHHLPHVGHVALLAHPDVLAHTLRLLRT